MVHVLAEEVEHRLPCLAPRLGGLASRQVTRTVQETI
jgi:hypothetical protein